MENSNKRKGSGLILEEQDRIGFREYRRTNLSLFLSALTAGLEIGFSVLLIGIVLTLFQSEIAPYWMDVIVAMAYPFGFILIIMGRSELFTEHTSLAMIPLLTGKASTKEMFGLWGFVIVGNLIGAFIFAYFISWFGPERGIISVAAFEEMAQPLLKPNWYILFTSALFAGWLMGLLSWLVASVKESISRIVIIALITFVIGLGHLHHSIVGAVEVFCGLLVSDAVTVNDCLYFLTYAVLGNTVGGAIFVSVLKYTQVRAEKNGE